MSVENSIYQVIADVIPNIYPTQPTPNTAKPFLVYTVTGSEPQRTLRGTGSLVKHTVQIESWADTLADANALLAQVRSRLDGYAGGNLHRCFWSGQDTEQAEDAYHATSIYTVWATQTANIVPTINNNSIIRTGEDFIELETCNGDRVMRLDCDGLTLDGQEVGGDTTLSTDGTTIGQIDGAIQPANASYLIFEPNIPPVGFPLPGPNPLRAVHGSQLPVTITNATKVNALDTASTPTDVLVVEQVMLPGENAEFVRRLPISDIGTPPLTLTVPPKTDYRSYFTTSSPVTVTYPANTPLTLATRNPSLSFSVNSGAWRREGVILPGDTLKLKAMTATTPNTPTTYQLHTTAGDIGWTVTSNTQFGTPIDPSDMALYLSVSDPGTILTDGGTVTGWIDSFNGITATVVGGGVTYVNGEIVLNGTGRFDVSIAGNVYQCLVVGRSLDPVWSTYGSFFETQSGTRLGNICEAGGTTWHANVHPAAVRKNGVSLSSPFNASPINSDMMLSVQFANTSNGTGNYHVGGLENGYRLRCAIKEIIVTKRLLTTSEVAAAETVMMDKWGI
jgi:hypothetical protein